MQTETTHDGRLETRDMDEATAASRRDETAIIDMRSE